MDMPSVDIYLSLPSLQTQYMKDLLTVLGSILSQIQHFFFIRVTINV